MHLLSDLIAEPLPLGTNYHECMEACFEAASACWICADTCMHAKDRGNFRATILQCLTTAEVCTATARRLIRGEEFPFEDTINQIITCMDACELLIKECNIHSGLECCRITSKCVEEVFRQCEGVLDGLSST